MGKNKNLDLWMRLSNRFPTKIGGYNLTFEKTEDDLLRAVLNGEDDSTIVDGDAILETIWLYIKKISRIIGLDPIWNRYNSIKITNFNYANQIDVKDIFDFDNFELNGQVHNYESYREVKQSFYEILNSTEKLFRKEIIVEVTKGNFKLYDNKVTSQSWGEEKRDDIEVYFPIKTSVIEFPGGERLTDDYIIEFMKSDFFTNNEFYKEGYWSDLTPNDVLEYLVMDISWAFIENPDSNSVVGYFFREFQNNYPYFYDTITMHVQCILDQLGDIKNYRSFYDITPDADTNQMFEVYRDWYRSVIKKS